MSGIKGLEEEQPASSSAGNEGICQYRERLDGERKGRLNVAYIAR